MLTNLFTRLPACSLAGGLILASFIASGASGQVAGLSAHPEIERAGKLGAMWIDYQMANKRVPGLSVALVYDQEVIWGGGFGRASLDRGTPATMDTLYSGCSMAKALTAIAVLQLRDQGEFDLDDDIEKLLPWLKIEHKYPESGPVTVRQLLAHSSGLPDDLDEPYWTTVEFPTVKAFRSGVAGIGTRYPSASRDNYSNVGIELVGALVADRSGLSIEDYVQRHIFEPLKMSDSSLAGPSADLGDTLATGYRGYGRGDAERRIPPYSIKGLAGSTGLVTSAADMARFLSWQFRNLDDGSELISSASQREAYRVHWYNAGSDVHRGLGYSVMDMDGQMLVGKDGGCPGYNSIFVLDPQRKVGIVVLINTNDMDPGRVAREIITLFQPALISAAAGVGEQASPTLEKYAGIYRSYHMEVGVVVKGDVLQLMSLDSQSPAGSVRVLKPFGGGRFAKLTEDGSFDRQVTFVEDDQGQVIRLQESGSYWQRIPVTSHVRR